MDTPPSRVPTWPEIEASADSLEAHLHSAIQRFLAGELEDAAREFREINSAYAPLKSAVFVRKNITRQHEEDEDRAERATLRKSAAQASTKPALVSIDRRAIEVLKGVDTAHGGSDRFRPADLAHRHHLDPLAADGALRPSDDDRARDDDFAHAPDDEEDDASGEFDLEDPDAGDSGLD